MMRFFLWWSGCRKSRLRAVWAAALTAPLLLGAAATNDEQTIDARFRALTEQLRCLVCQNETLADSSADLAISLRREIREMMTKGASDRDVIAFLTARYGDFVLYRPPLKPKTWLLWFGPLLGLIASIVGVMLWLRRRETTPEVPLSAAERARVQALMEETRGGETP